MSKKKGKGGEVSTPNLVRSISVSSDPDDNEPPRSRFLAQYRKLALSSLLTGSLTFQTPGVQPNTAYSTVQISDLERIYYTVPIAHKAINLRANRLIGDGFELMPSDHKDADPVIAEQA